MNDADTRAAMIGLLPELRGYARFLAGSVGEADDLVQDTVMRALAAIAQYHPGTSLRAWLFTILRNAFYETARRRRSERRALERHVSVAVSEPPRQSDALELADLSRHLFDLPPLLREALILVGAQGISHEEAAQICGVSVGTMRVRVSRARSQLARLIGDATARRGVMP